MKNLPDKFPIRYALVIEALDDDFKDDLILNQYLELIHKNPMDYSLIFPEFNSVIFNILDQEAFKITKVGNDDSWTKSIKDKIREVIPEVSLKGWSRGNAARIGMYSYKKAAEIPAFVSFNRSIERSGLGNSDYFNKIFDNIRLGKYDSFGLYQDLKSFLNGTIQELSYSNCWKELDRNKELKGIVTSQSGDISEKIFKTLPLTKPNNDMIPVMVCFSWDELFAEEVFAVYKMFNYCNNCGKALPFNYTGKYCPEGLENIECIRERARKRKHSQNSN